ncbi:recombinase family protein [Spongiactinospora sp. TRM90649]|uniref:recombinase family protein n=1 Tax=Spongiactinospora sp. TRM90649 TaxID=3031114 RepID=UPI0023F73A43|nr:recombinase family protein [Spongiactinospora sp. TRM90649]MDF5757320.1 recombinase family protein [Spongiactinospora sp. TRM90649]
MTGRILAYVRVSSRDQNPQLQIDAIEASGYDQMFTEKLSGKHGVDRPEWRRLLEIAGKGDTVKFWKSDRWGRTAAHVLTTVNDLRGRGVKIVSLTENFDLDTKEGRFMFAVLAAAAEYELELRAERQSDGIAAAARREAEGRRLPGKKKTGRPRVIGPAELATLRRLVDDGVSVTEAARTLKIGRSTAYQALATAQQTTRPRAPSWKPSWRPCPQTAAQRLQSPPTTDCSVEYQAPRPDRSHGFSRSRIPPGRTPADRHGHDPCRRGGPVGRRPRVIRRMWRRR